MMLLSTYAEHNAVRCAPIIFQCSVYACGRTVRTAYFHFCCAASSNPISIEFVLLLALIRMRRWRFGVWRARSARTLNNLYYLSWMTSMAADEQQPAWRSGICKAHPELVSVLLLVVLVSIVLIKAYAIGIIWRCYKYLTMRRNVMLPYVIPVISARRVSQLHNLQL